MENNDFLNSLHGAYTCFLSRRIRRSIFLFSQTPPLSKNAMKKTEQIEFQRDILQQLKNQRRRGFNENTALSVTILASTKEKNPPQIDKIPKNYLDLLSKSLLPSKRKIIFIDDSQIKHLHMSYITNSETNNICFIIYPYNSLLEDIEAVYEYTDYYTEEDNDDYYHFLHSYIEYKNERYIYEYSSRHWEMYKKSLQLELFCLPKYNIDILYHMLCINKKYEQNSFVYEKAHLKSFLNIILPPLPHMKNETKTFKMSIKEQMKKFKAEYFFLDDIQYPISLIVFYIPPKANHYTKDLDNIMRIIIPIFLDVFNTKIHKIAEYEIFEMPLENIEDDNRYLSIIIRQRNHVSIYNYLQDRMDYILECSE